MKKKLFSVIAMTLYALLGHGQTHNLSQDFSFTANPNGVWSYGYQNALGSAFVTLTYPKMKTSENGIQFWAWEKQANETAGVYHNPSTATMTSDGGDGVYPAKTTFFYPGSAGRTDNFAVIRFTAPAAGIYRLDTGVLPIYTTRQGDTDFHVLRNGIELYGVNLSGSATARYSNEVALAAGDVIDLAIGRGADNSLNYSGLRIQATLDLLAPPPPSLTLVVPRINENLDGSATDGGGSGILTHEARAQTVYGASQFPTSTLLRITEIRMRPSAVWGGAFTSTIPNLQVNMSTTAARANNLSATFADNVGASETVVFRGPITLSSRFVGPPSGPKEFDIIIPLQTPFTYDPAAGNLLVEIRNPSATSVASIDAGGLLNDDCSRAYAFSASATTANTRDKAAEVLQLVYERQSPPPPPPPPASDYDLSRDFSITANPNGVWSYGYENALGSAFVLLQYPKTNRSENGVPIWAWEKQPPESAGVYHNPSATTATSDGGDGIYPSKTTFFYPGYPGRMDNFAVIRFTAPPGGGGTYRLDTGVLPIYTTRQGDTDFHVLRNGIELYGVNLSGSATARYSNEVALAVGDVIDLAIGRGADNSLNYSGLKIQATLDLVSTNLPPPPPPPPPASDFDLSRDFSITANPNGVWSYGYETALGSPLVLFQYPKTNFTDNGVAIWAWEKQAPDVAGVYHNPSTTQTGVSQGGDAQIEPKTTYFYPGRPGFVDNFGVIRFTAPAGGSGTYRLEAQVRPVYNTLQRDTDFHILRNGAELYGVSLNGSATGRYSNEVALAAGDVIDLAIGRGADNSFDFSGLKIQATLDLVSTNPPPPNNPPVADAVVSPIVDLSPKMTNLLVISANGSSATVTLSGAGSSDPDGDALQYAWYVNGSDTPVATGVTANVSLALGSHIIVLVVNDGSALASDTVEVEVITVEDAINVLIVLVDDTDLSRKQKRPLIEALKKAGDAFGDDHVRSAINKLQSFQNKVAAQITRINAECAEILIDAAQQIIDALPNDPGGNR